MTIRNFLRRWFSLDEPTVVPGHTASITGLPPLPPGRMMGVESHDEVVTPDSMTDGQIIWQGLSDLQRFNHWGAL